MKTRCTKHTMHWNPCPICKEIEYNKAMTEVAKKEMEEYRKDYSDVMQRLSKEKNTYKEMMEEKSKIELELRDLLVKEKRRVDSLEQEIESLKEDLDVKIKDLLEENTDMSLALEEAMNKAYNNFNPEARVKLSVHDLVMVRGMFAANTFLLSCLNELPRCIEMKKDKQTKEQLSLIKIDVENSLKKFTDIIAMFAKEFSASNWNRMEKEVQKISDLSVDIMNSRELGSFTIAVKDEGLYLDYDIKADIEKAVAKAINSAGTNSFTAYSKIILVNELTEILKDK